MYRQQMPQPDGTWHLQHLHPEAEVYPLAIKVMAEIGIDISSHYPKNVSQYLDQSWDYVITVCGGAKLRRGMSTEQGRLMLMI